MPQALAPVLSLLPLKRPKGLLEVFGERMIERQIRQLHEAGVYDITIAVGYLKEKFEYLIDKYDVKLLYNPEYSCKNTLATVYRARHLLKGRNMYILSSDNWLRDNMFHAYECGAWYASSYMEGDTSEWCLSFNKKGRITHVEVGGHDSWVMYGPVFFSASFSEQFLPLLEQYYHTPGTEQFYWENVLIEHLDTLEMDINRQPEHQIYELKIWRSCACLMNAIRTIRIMRQWIWYPGYLRCLSPILQISASPESRNDK